MLEKLSFDLKQQFLNEKINENDELRKAREEPELMITTNDI